MTPSQWILITLALAVTLAGLWAQRYMYRNPIPGMLLRYFLYFSFAVLVGLALALDGVAIETAILVIALVTGLFWGLVFYDAIVIFEFCYEGTAETAE